MSLDTAISNFCTAVGNVDGINKVYQHEPARLDVFPAVSLFFLGGPQAPSSTNRWSQINWLFRCSLTVKVDSLEAAQEQFVDLIPKIYKVTRNDPSLSGSCDWADVNDSRETEPYYIEELKGARKDLYLTITTTEQ